MIFRLEENQHKDDLKGGYLMSASMSLCMKHFYENRCVDKILWAGERPCIRNIYAKIFPEYFHRLIRTYKFLWFTTIVGAIIELFLYYLDFFKDWFIVILVQSYMGNSNFLTIGGHGPRESHWHTDGYF